LARIEEMDVRLFEFDLDLTFMVFFLNADESVYGRFGGRDAKDAENRQSLPGLRYAMQAALESHRGGVLSAELQIRGTSKDFRNLSTVSQATASVGCMHCHRVKEVLYDDLRENGQWDQELVWRYPPPDNLGLVLEVDRGNVVERVEPNSPAAEVGIKPGDVVEELGNLPVHSFADAQFALDRAPSSGLLSIEWTSGDESLRGNFSLPEGWRRTDITWRPSMLAMVATAPVNGEDLTLDERKKHGLAPAQLAFWQQSKVSAVAQSAGIRPGELIIGFDGKTPEMDAYQFQSFVRSDYVADDTVTVEVLRNGKRLSLPMILK